MDTEGVMHFPGFSPESAKLLVERDVAGIGIDTLSLDYGPSTDFATHKIMLEAGIYQIDRLGGGAQIMRARPAGNDDKIRYGTLMILDLIASNNWERPVYFNNRPPHNYQYAI